MVVKNTVGHPSQHGACHACAFVCVCVYVSVLRHKSVRRCSLLSTTRRQPGGCIWKTQRPSCWRWGVQVSLNDPLPWFVCVPRMPVEVRVCVCVCFNRMSLFCVCMCWKRKRGGGWAALWMRELLPSPWCWAPFAPTQRRTCLSWWMSFCRFMAWRPQGHASGRKWVGYVAHDRQSIVHVVPLAPASPCLPPTQACMPAEEIRTQLTVR
jgi:hypothetical protein